MVKKDNKNVSSGSNEKVKLLIIFFSALITALILVSIFMQILD